MGPPPSPAEVGPSSPPSGVVLVAVAGAAVMVPSVAWPLHAAATTSPLALVDGVTPLGDEEEEEEEEEPPPVGEPLEEDVATP